MLSDRSRQGSRPFGFGGIGRPHGCVDSPDTTPWPHRKYRCIGKTPQCVVGDAPRADSDGAHNGLLLPRSVSGLSGVRGFTFIELMMSVAIMALLLWVAVPMLELGIQRQQERELRFALISIRRALDEYAEASRSGRIPIELGRAGFPEDLEQLVSGVEDQQDPDGRKIYFLRRIPADPMHAGQDLPAAETWGLRSYASPPDDPEEGEEIFDVYSKSDGIGLNGVPYRDW